MTQSRTQRLSLRRSSLEELEPRRVLAGPGDDAPVLPVGPAGELIQQYAGLLRSPAQYTLIGSQLSIDGRAPKSLRSNAGGATKAQTSTAATRIYEAESLDAFLLDINDIAEDAEHIPLGFGAGQVDAIDVRGSIEEPILPGTVNSVEDDGSIPLANETSLIAGSAINAAGTIGDGPNVATGDFDFYRIADVEAGDLITARVEGFGGLDPAVAIYNSVGDLQITNDDSGNTLNSFVSYIAAEADDYYVLVLGSGFFGFTLPTNPFDPTSGNPFLDTTGPYDATIGLNYGDVDYYSVDLNPGDIFSLDMLGASNDIALFDSDGVELIGNRDAGSGTIYPADTALESVGNASIPYVINEPGRYFVRVLGDFNGNYEGRFRLYRPVLEQEDPGTKQILFVDFDGETIETNIFGMPGIAELSPLRDFLPGWGLNANQESRVIDAVLDVVKEQYRDVGRRGLNGDYATSGEAGDYGIEIRNSRDHADPFGRPNVSRIIVGGTILELGIPTIGIAQSVDPGNFNTSETGVVLLDSLSAPEFDSLFGIRNDDSLNSFLVNSPGKNKADLIGVGVGTIVSHEAGHFFGNFHTIRDNDVPNIMDTGGDLRLTAGIGADGILGTQDDVQVRFGVDEYSEEEFFTGIEDTRNTIAFGLPTGRGKRSASASGVKWNDLNGDGERNSGEPGIADFVIYVDVNGDNEFGIGEPAAVTRADGGYTLRNVPSGTYAVREVVEPGWVQTFPEDGEHIITFSLSGEARGADFGNRRGEGGDEGRDFGDAPSPYPTRIGQNGASHGIVPGFRLGAEIDGELNGQPTNAANGDDLNGQDDEDGVFFVTDLLPGATSLVDVTVSNGTQPPGVLHAWIDFDGDGAWTTNGEQIFSDRAVSEGVNRLSFDVPEWALLGTTYARFRYSYERGLSFTGEAVAGEVEDHLVDIVRGGPVANDDNFNVRRNSEDVNLNVLANDLFRPGSETRIINASTPNNGGSVEIAANGLSLVYSPGFDFDGLESFTYTVEDINGLRDSANVSVFVQPDLALIRLGIADISNGTPITQVSVGQQFLLQGFVQDLRDVGTGVFAAYSDVRYPATAATVQGAIFYGPDYPNGQTGDAQEPGLIDEVGAFDGIDRLGPEEALLFSVPMRASAAGVFEFIPDPADVLPQHNVLLFDSSDPVPTEQIEYRGVELTVTAAASNLKTNPLNSLDVDNDSSVSPIDALLVINELNDASVPSARSANRANVFLDVSSDGVLSPLDALLIINELNRVSAADGLAAVAAAVEAIDEPEMRSANVTDPTVESTGELRRQREPLMDQRGQVFDTIEDLDLALTDSSDELDTVLDLISNDVLKAGDQ